MDFPRALGSVLEFMARRAELGRHHLRLRIVSGIFLGEVTKEDVHMTYRGRTPSRKGLGGTVCAKGESTPETWGRLP